MPASGPEWAAQPHQVAGVLTSASSAPSALVIEGQAGIGKTTLRLSAVDAVPFRNGLTKRSGPTKGVA
jgi:predicted ATP-dependent serine protease